MAYRLRRLKWLLKTRKAVVFGYIVLSLLGLGAALELYGTINLIPTSETENEISQIASVVGAFGSVALSFGLFMLYARQTKILEQQYQPFLTGELELSTAVSTQFVVRNSGSDFAYDIEAEWTVGDESRTWEKPSLAPDERAAFPLVVDENGRWLLQTSQLRDYFEENDVNPNIEYTIRCKDQFGIPRRFTGHVDFDVIGNREQSNEIWEEDPIQTIDSSLSSIEASIDAIASDIGDRRDEEEWQDRWKKNRAIVNLVNETGEVSIDALGRIIGSKRSLEYRLSELEEAGLLHYDERNGLIQAPPTAGNNHTLSEYNEN